MGRRYTQIGKISILNKTVKIVKVAKIVKKYTKAKKQDADTRRLAG